MSKTFITSDTHFNHVKILDYCSDRRLGREITESNTDLLLSDMNEFIVSKWNSVVSPEDTVYHLGDCCMGIIDKSIKYLHRLNGKKILIKGNHDKTLCKHPDLMNIFSEVCDYKEITYKYNSEKHFICMSHFPMKFWNRMNNDVLKTSIHCHGHTHASHGLHLGPGAIIDVGSDGNNLTPYLLDDVIKLALSNAKKLPSTHHHS